MRVFGWILTVFGFGTLVTVLLAGAVRDYIHRCQDGRACWWEPVGVLVIVSMFVGLHLLDKTERGE